VIASNNDGVWNETGATLDFKVAAAWYQTIWFRALCFLAGVLLLWAIYRLRLRQIAGHMKARFDERLAERTRIARDLHDTFLQTIQGSKLVADDALSATTDLSHSRGETVGVAGTGDRGGSGRPELLAHFSHRGE
jgi:signal transduction histidine kinase